ncbi:pili/flagellar assembly PapD-like chaperone [Desulfobotulus alkaliphilus]|uniref:Pili/flagellar assembly PapD-like chaperone n=1 Tax=Desulfobotulus alkaliphilus TaxID=622671 RepID=A0A562S825_9BACT|nr:fimbria/pilus periplasmic chaperone [Desulfobotulus alkaliphilus]TWI76874.1 pili/flagellar assembly PapD-like chaperone [Desulfobotulus alkaliphilus]
MLRNLLFPAFFLAAFFFCLPAPSLATGALVTPLRFVLEDRERSATMRIVNTNDRSVSYRIETVLMEQDMSGRTREIKNLEDHGDLLRMVRFSPRQIRLEPHEMQAVRIMVRKPADLQDGEYRVHMKVSPLPETPDRVQMPGKDEPASSTTITIHTLVSTILPLIIRHGETSVSLDARGLELESLPGDRKALKTLLIAEGNRSAFMDAAFFWEDTLIAERKGFAIYQPNGKLNISFPLQEDLPPSGSTLRLVLHDREKEGNPLLKEIPLVLNY